MFQHVNLSMQSVSSIFSGTAVPMSVCALHGVSTGATLLLQRDMVAVAKTPFHVTMLIFPGVRGLVWTRESRVDMNDLHDD